MRTEHYDEKETFSYVLRVSHLYGVRFWSIVALSLGFLLVVGVGLLFALERLWLYIPVGGREISLVLGLIAWLLVSSALVQWTYEKIWQRPVSIRDLGSQVAISVGDREDRLPWSDLRKVKLHRYRVGQVGLMRTKSLNLVLTFQGRTYRLGTDEHQLPLKSLAAYCREKGNTQ